MAMETRRVGRAELIRNPGTGRWENPGLGTRLTEYREAARKTQDDVAREMEAQLAPIGEHADRAYVGGIEAGRFKAMGPERFNAIKHVLKFPGWELVELMGYETDISGPPELDPVVVQFFGRVSRSRQVEIVRTLEQVGALTGS